MKYAVEMASGIIMYKSSFVNIGSVQKLLEGKKHTGTHTQRQQRDLIKLPFFLNKLS
jgi:hypothetical protein